MLIEVIGRLSLPDDIDRDDAEDLLADAPGCARPRPVRTVRHRPPDSVTRATRSTLLSHDWHTADDLVSTALHKLYLNWARAVRGPARLDRGRRLLRGEQPGGQRREEHRLDRPGNWLTYRIDVATAGRYDLELRVANGTGAVAADAVSLRDAAGTVLARASVPAARPAASTWTTCA